MIVAIVYGLNISGIGSLRKELNVLVTKDGGAPFGW